MSLVPIEARKAIDDGRIEDAIWLLFKAGLDVEIKFGQTPNGQPGQITLIDNTAEEIDDEDPLTASEASCGSPIQSA